jgi:transposase
VAELIAERTPEGEYGVHPDGVQEVVADKGYHTNEVVLGLVEIEVLTYIAEPDRGPRNWNGKAAEKAAVYGNRRRIQGDRGKGLQRQRGERIERNFVHQFDTGGLDRLYIRGKETVHKKFLIQAAACNLALLMRSPYGSGKPRAAHDGVIDAILAILAVIKPVADVFTAWLANSHSEVRVLCRSDRCHQPFSAVAKRLV